RSLRLTSRGRGCRKHCRRWRLRGQRDRPVGPSMGAVAMIDVIGMLCEKFPAAFFQFERRRKPLALGIHKQIAEALPTLNKVQISGAMRRYVKNTFYLKACVEGASRIDLNGEAAGTVSGNDAASCASRLAAIKLARKRK